MLRHVSPDRRDVQLKPGLRQVATYLSVVCGARLTESLPQTICALPVRRISNPGPHSNSQLRGLGGIGLTPPLTSHRRLGGG